MILLNIYIILYTKKYIFKKDTLPSLDSFVAIIPGAGLTKDKKPSKVLADRLEGGILLYKKGIVNKLLISGDHKGEHYSETDSMEKYLIENGIPKENIIRDDKGFSTFETVLNSKKQYYVENAFFVSQAFHLPRLVFIAKRFGMNAFGLECNFHTYSKTKHRKWKAREIPSRVKDFFLSTYYILFKKI